MRPALIAAVLSGCGWNHLPNHGSATLDGPLWDPYSVIATNDGLYAAVGTNGGLAFLKGGGSTLVDLGDRSFVSAQVTPDRETAIATVSRYFCDDPDPRNRKKVKVPSDCEEEYLRVETDLAVLRGGAIESDLTLDGPASKLVFADDSRFAIAFLDPNTDLSTVNEVIDLTAVNVLDLDSGDATPVSVGFEPTRVLFTHTPEGQAERAIVLSENEAAVVDLFADPPALDVTFPLTLDPDTELVPTGVSIAESRDDDGALEGLFALITAQGSSDLFALDLLNHSVNIVELPGQPADMEATSASDQTVLVYATESRVDLLDHAQFGLESFSLDVPMSEVLMGEDKAVLWQPGEQDVYRFHPDSGDLVEYRLHSPPIGMHLAPTGEFAIARTAAAGDFESDGRNGMEVLDLSDDDVRPFLLQGAPIDLAWTAGDGVLKALVLQEDVNTLFEYDLYTGDQVEIDLPAPPLDIGSLPDGGFFIAHDSGAGMVSILSEDGDLTTIAGFAVLGLLEEQPIAEEVSQ